MNTFIFHGFWIQGKGLFQQLAGGFPKSLNIFTPKIGGRGSHFDEHIFFRWVGSTTNQIGHDIYLPTIDFQKNMLVFLGLISRELLVKSLYDSSMRFAKVHF